VQADAHSTTSRQSSALPDGTIVIVAPVSRSISLRPEHVRNTAVSFLISCSVERFDLVKTISASPDMIVPRRLLMNVPMILIAPVRRLDIERTRTPDGAMLEANDLSADRFTDPDGVTEPATLSVGARSVDKAPVIAVAAVFFTETNLAIAPERAADPAKRRDVDLVNIPDGVMDAASAFKATFRFTIAPVGENEPAFLIETSFRNEPVEVVLPALKIDAAFFNAADGDIEPVRNFANNLIANNTPLGVIDPPLKIDTAFMIPPAGVVEPASFFESDLVRDPVGVELPATDLFASFARTADGVIEPASVLNNVFTVANAPLGVVDPARDFESALVTDPVAVELPLRKIETAFVTIAVGVIDPARLCVFNLRAANVPFVVEEPLTILLASFAIAPAGAMLPARGFEVNFVRLATPPGVVLPDFLTETSFLIAPAGVADPPRFCVNVVPLASANSASTMMPRQYRSGVASDAYPQRAFRLLNAALPDEFAFHAPPVVGAVANCFVANRSVTTPATTPLAMIVLSVPLSLILAVKSHVAVDASRSAVITSTARGPAVGVETPVPGPNLTSTY
jgi:hypothetical protein